MFLKCSKTHRGKVSAWSEVVGEILTGNFDWGILTGGILICHPINHASIYRNYVFPERLGKSGDDKISHWLFISQT